MTVAVAAGEVGRALRWDRVEAEYVDPGRGRERAPLAVCWPLRFERMSPVPGFASFRGQRNWPGWCWFSRTGEHVGHESWLGRDVHGRLLARDQWQARLIDKHGMTDVCYPGGPGLRPGYGFRPATQARTEQPATLTAHRLITQTA